MTPCKVEGCDRTDIYEIHGLCRKHYQRWRKTGDAEGLRNIPTSPAERFWRRVDKSGDCWLWTGGRNPHGYGRFQAGSSRESSRVMLAHIYAYEALVGPVPPGLELDHLCRVRNCVNPRHLDPVTHAENIRRGRWGVLKYKEIS